MPDVCKKSCTKLSVPCGPRMRVFHGTFIGFGDLLVSTFTVLA